MLESAVVAHTVIQRVLAGVTERCVTEIVRKTDRLGERLVQSQCARDRACDLRDLDRVREAGAVQVAFVIDEYLSLVNESPKGGRVDDPVAIALILAAIIEEPLRCSADPRLSRLGGGVGGKR